MSRSVFALACPSPNAIRIARPRLRHAAARQGMKGSRALPMPSFLGLSSYLILGLTLVVGMLIGALATALSRMKGENPTSLLTTISAIVQAISVAVAIVAVIVSLNVAQEQSVQTKRQYTRDLLDKYQTEATKKALQNVAQLNLDAILYSTRDSMIDKLREKSGGEVSDVKFYIGDGREVDLKTYKADIVRKIGLMREGVKDIIETKSSIDACIVSGLCDEKLAKEASCNIYLALRGLNKSLAPDGPLEKMSSEEKKNDAMTITIAIQQIVGIVVENSDIYCPSDVLSPRNTKH